MAGMIRSVLAVLRADDAGECDRGRDVTLLSPTASFGTPATQ